MTARTEGAAIPAPSHSSPPRLPPPQVNSLLDDHIVLTQQFSFSPYKGPFEERISQWEAKLRMVQEVISEWLACQV